MKRPFAVIGFSMLATFLLVTNISHKTTVIFLIGVIAAFCVFVLFKKLRKHMTIIFSLIGVIAFTFSFIATEKNYMDKETQFKSQDIIKGVVCQTPTNSDYAFTYVVKPHNESYKIRFSSQDNKFLTEGDYVNIKIGNFENSSDAQFVKFALSSRVYFTLFESEECTIEKTGETNFFYRNIGVIKRGFLSIVDRYLPGENGAMAKAMTIGDETEIDDNTIAQFKYCGTSHLLVISGLHLSLWSFGIMKYLNKFSKLRKLAPFIGIGCLLLYSSITGFSVSVIRAGAMVASVLIARIFNRDADSINSIGTALTFILLINPFSAFSEALWLTTFSTLGILVLSKPIQYRLVNVIGKELVNKYSILRFVLDSVSISLSVAVFTLPIFVFSYKMIPTASILSNLLMVEAAMVFMVLTVIGAVLHLISFYPLAKTCFFIVGLIGKYLRFTAEKIGMAEWSTISLDNELYGYFLILLVICMCIVLIARRYGKNILTPVAVILSVIFVLLTVYCNNYEYNTSTIDVVGTDSSPIIIVNSGENNLLLGLHSKKEISKIRTVMEEHNKKKLDLVAVTEIDNKSVSQIVNMKENLYVGKFVNDVSQIKLSDNLLVSLDEKNSCVVISSYGKTLLIVDCEKTENLFENEEMYDIILLYGENTVESKDRVKAFSKQVYVVKENERISVEL